MTRGPELATTAATVGPYLTAKLRALDAALAQVAPRASAPNDDEAVHDLRVAMRRTRTVLELGRPVLGRFHADEVRRELRDLQRTTGALRDEEVLLQLVASLGVSRPDVDRWLEAHRRRERHLRRVLVRSLRAGELDRGRRLLQAMLAFRIKPARNKRLPKFARRAVERARREVDRRRAAPVDDALGLHELRIACKRLRYTVETFADALGAEQLDLGARAVELQKRLGDLHDVDMAFAAIRRARALGNEARLALLDALVRRREACVARYQREIAAVEQAAVPVDDQAVGGDSLRKISTR
jgi:CHAD domain-containing protein